MNRIIGLPALLSVAFLLRLAWAALVPVNPVSDAAAYEIFAQNLYHLLEINVAFVIRFDAFNLNSICRGMVGQARRHTTG